VDGYDADGNRVYDKVRGQTCHQCRQKTMGKRTACSSCASLQGVFCGDCLFMRYGENIEEVNDNPEWVCPHCRDLCNCSFHRSRRGWAPTGTLYRRAVAQGYASVAHYLVLNNLEDAAKEEALPLMPAELATATRAELKAMAEGQGKEAALLVPSSAEQSASECEGAPAKREQGAEMVAKRTARRDQGSIGVLPRGKVHKAQVAEVGKKRQREAPQSETVIRNRGLHDTA